MNENTVSQSIWPTTCAAITAAMALSAIPSAVGQDQMWMTQFGTIQPEDVASLSPDGAGGLFASGRTGGGLGGPSAGDFDGYLARYDNTGTQLWIKQYGTNSYDMSKVTTDGAGGAIVAGTTGGSLGGTSAGVADVFVLRYDSAGNQLWNRQFGTPRDDVLEAVTTDDAGGAYIGGRTLGRLNGNSSGNFDAFLARYDADGNQLWITQFGSIDGEGINALSPDGAGGVFVLGVTLGSLFGPYMGGFGDVFVTHYDSDGNQLWARQFGTTTDDWPTAIASDGAGGMMIAGFTLGDLGGTNAGGNDAFVTRYDVAGNQLWLTQFGTSSSDAALGIALDETGTGGVMVVGWTEGDLGGRNAGLKDAYLVRLDSAGNQLSERQFGTPSDDVAWPVMSDGVGGVFVGGGTLGDLGGPNAGGQDCFLARYTFDSCYADSDYSTGIGTLDIFDFLSFQNSFVNGETYACDCNTSTGPLVCDLFDFLCFQNAFVGGCP